jgi:hypothetical protein
MGRSPVTFIFSSLEIICTSESLVVYGMAELKRGDDGVNGLKGRGCLSLLLSWLERINGGRRLL